jgi:hypothetical protein
MRDVFNVYGDRSINAESNYKYSGRKIQKEIKILGENTIVYYFVIIEIRYPHKFEPTVSSTETKKKIPYHIISRDWMRW